MWNNEGHDYFPIQGVIQYDSYHSYVLPDVKQYPVVNYKLHVQILPRSHIHQNNHAFNLVVFCLISRSKMISYTDYWNRYEKS